MQPRWDEAVEVLQKLRDDPNCHVLDQAVWFLLPLTSASERQAFGGKIAQDMLPEPMLPASMDSRGIIAPL